jgi:mono/diheme cytochrome c family protein
MAILRKAMNMKMRTFVMTSLAAAMVTPPLQAQNTVPPVAAAPPPLTNLVWDAETKEVTIPEGDTNIYAHFAFQFTNTAASEFVITDARSFCFCTVPSLPSKPWHLPPGTNGSIPVTMDLRGKFGTVQKEVVVETTSGSKQLLVRAHIHSTPAPPGTPVPKGRTEAERLAAMGKALVDRQVVFRDASCTSCHSTPALGKTDGMALYNGVCSVCHDSKNRAPTVTDLRALKHETDLDYWKFWITSGREGTMMPAFSQAQGGPLNEEQIATLATYCLKTFQPVTTTGTTHPTGASPGPK